ncbi:MAG: hypothetical protein FRX49_05173 [Trebouxia sp. A1-2]|nr:MAG: hypothetical protein FRX49_05173 [Trebouxia sp. A1-2]
MPAHCIPAPVGTQLLLWFEDLVSVASIQQSLLAAPRGDRGGHDKFESGQVPGGPRSPPEKKRKYNTFWRQFTKKNSTKSTTLKHEEQKRAHLHTWLCTGKTEARQVSLLTWRSTVV